MVTKSIHTLSSAHQSLDLPEFSERPTTYVIASQPRSGSHYLCELLRQTRVAGCPLEYFHPRHWQEWQQRCRSKQAAHIFKTLTRRRTSPNGIFGVKTHWSQFAHLVKVGLEGEFRGTKFVYLTRDDVLGQAVSYAIAMQTGQWVTAHAQAKSPNYSQSDIEAAIDLVLDQRSHWEKFFCHAGVQPLRLVYESLIQTPQEHIDRTLAFIGASRDSAPMTLTVDSTQIQRNAINEQWRERFLLGAGIQHDERHKWRFLLKEQMHGPAAAAKTVNNTQRRDTESPPTLAAPSKIE